MPYEPLPKGGSQPICNKNSVHRIMQGLNRWPRAIILTIGMLILFPAIDVPVFPDDAGAVEQKASDSSPSKDIPNDPAILQKRFQKVIMESLSRQKIPFSQFSWLAPKAIDANIQALPFSIVVGTQKIVLPVYIINHRYLVTTPLLDITRNYAVVPNIPAPQPVALFIPSSTFPLEKFPSAGPSDAPHTVIEFGDEQCPTCRKWNREVQQQVIADKSIRFVYIPYPLTTIHKNALDAAIFEMCVFQEKPEAFWTIHNQIDQRVDLKNIDKEALRPIFSGFMIKAGISTAKVQHCMDQSQPLPLISSAGEALTSRIGVPSTPTFIIDGNVKSGYLSYEDIRQSFSDRSKPLSKSGN